MPDPDECVQGKPMEAEISKPEPMCYFRRNCAHCQHFIPDNDLTDPEYKPDVDGRCTEGGFTEIGNALLIREPTNPMYCHSWTLAEDIKEIPKLCCFDCDQRETCGMVCEDILNGNTDKPSTCCFYIDGACTIS